MTQLNAPPGTNEADYGVYENPDAKEFTTDRFRLVRKANWVSSRHPFNVFLPHSLPASLGDATLISNYCHSSKESNYISFCNGSYKSIHLSSL